MSSLPEPPFSQGVGYGLTIGLGAIFGLGMWLTTILLAKFSNQVQGSEMFMTAKHSVKSGLIASAVVSSWTISATLLTSTSWTFSYGAGGAYYCAFCCVQIFLFAVAAIELKRKAPNAHTMLETTQIRYGAPGHWIQIIFSTIYQIVNCSTILVGVAAVFNALTGMNLYAGIFLIPIGTVLYTLTGGIKATFLTDYIHTVILYIIILVGLFQAYTTSDLIGSPDRMWELLTTAAVDTPNTSNPEGSYLTLHNTEALLYGLVIFCGSFAATVDVQLFQKAIAAQPESTFVGYFLGCMCWFSIPFCLATTFGFVARALQSDPNFPTYPNPMTASEIGSGLVLPYAAQTLMGKGGSIGVLLMCYMAATSAFSSDLVCFTSVWTFDVYRTYINPQATGSRLVKLGHFAVVGFSVLCAAIACALTTSSVGINFLVTFIGVLVNPATVPLAMTILWKQQNVYAVVGAPILSFCCAMAGWIGYTYHAYGVVEIGALSHALPLLIAQLIALLSPLIFSPAITYLTGPQNFDWAKFKEIKIVDDSDVAGITAAQLAEQEAEMHTNNEMSPEIDAKMVRGRNISLYGSIGSFLGFCILLPLPLYGTKYIFGRKFFRFWIVWTFLWAIGAAATITLLPILQGRRSLVAFTKMVILGNKPVVVEQQENGSRSDVDESTYRLGQNEKA